MDFEFKEHLGFAIAIVVAIVGLALFAKFGAFVIIGDVIDSITGAY